ncbi:hypothetical protein [Devriesea agamarum]|uniref:hypothetical protein n=1 Tax=Devriesea agamarum TaxID=472569 RepID=UPI00071C296B|nr:hypothetical protein [Devriesea agamarum]
MGDLVALPRVSALSLWTAAYLAGQIGPDDALDQARGHGHRHEHVTGEDLFEWMVHRRQGPAKLLRVVLPVPGRLAGMQGPPEAVRDALKNAGALIVHDGQQSDHVLIACTEIVGSADDQLLQVTWKKYQVAEPQPVVRSGPALSASAPVPVVGDAQSHRVITNAPIADSMHVAQSREIFLRSLRHAAASMRAADLVPDEPVHPGLLPDTWVACELPSGSTDGHEHLLRIVSRTLLLTAEAATSLPSPGMSAQDCEHHRRVLRDLAGDARDALAALTSYDGHVVE